MSKAVGRLCGSAGLEKYSQQLGRPPELSYYGGHSNPFGDGGHGLDCLYTADFRDIVGKNLPGVGAPEWLTTGPFGDQINRMLYTDTKTWLVDDLLLKADKMTMANSIELRVPLLDHKLLEFAASLPGSYKVRGLTTKYLLKKVLGTRVPKEILRRKKVGFPVPYGSWLRKEMKDWVSDILADPKTLESRIFPKIWC